MARSKRGRRKGKMSWVDIGLAANAAGQFAEPFLQRGVHTAVQSGDVQAAITAVREGSKEAAGFQNLVQAAGPWMLKKLIFRFIPKPRIKVGGRGLI